MRGVESMREKEGREECKERREMQKEKKNQKSWPRPLRKAILLNLEEGSFP